MDRFLAGIAYLDGKRPSMIFSRGYYTRTVSPPGTSATDELTRRWTFDTNSSTNTGRGYDGQGNHHLSIADVDGDGRDEIIYGAMAVDDDGARLWTTGCGHGDALHVGDFDPRPARARGVRHPRELLPARRLASADARTGSTSGAHRLRRRDRARRRRRHRRGQPRRRIWASAAWTAWNTPATAIGRKPGSCNFGVWWDGDLSANCSTDTASTSTDRAATRRLLTGSGVASNNGTKATPSLSGDILGDWREEVIWRTTDNKALRIYTTPNPTSTGSTP